MPLTILVEIRRHFALAGYWSMIIKEVINFALCAILSFVFVGVASVWLV